MPRQSVRVGGSECLAMGGVDGTRRVFVGDADVANQTAGIGGCVHTLNQLVGRRKDNGNEQTRFREMHGVYALVEAIPFSGYD